MNHYRVTRPNVYKSPNCPGHTDKSARQGHYVDASTPEEARALIQKRLGLPETEPLDVQFWRTA